MRQLACHKTFCSIATFAFLAAYGSVSGSPFFGSSRTSRSKLSCSEPSGVRFFSAVSAAYCRCCFYFHHPFPSSVLPSLRSFAHPSFCGGKHAWEEWGLRGRIL